MNHRSPQCILEVVLLDALACQILRCERPHVQLEWEAEVAIDFYFPHLIIVELETLEGYNKDIWQIFEAESLQSSHFLLAGLAKISVVSIKDLPIYKAL